MMTDSKVCKTLFIYWLVLILWQNFGNYVSNSGISMVIKFVLIIYLAFNFIKKSSFTNYRNLLPWLLFAAFMIISLVINGIDSSEALIYYVFPVVFTFLTFICKGRQKVSEKDYHRFLHAIIIVVMCMAIYSFLFQTEHFAYIFSSADTYGNELSSFLVSNHEYGMYLVFGIISCILCYLSTDEFIARGIYILIIAIFAINLLATFSRTSMLALAVFCITFFLLSSKNKIRKYLIIAIVAFLLILVFVPEARTYILRLVFKEDADAGRSDMWNAGVAFFKSESFINQIFGLGYTNITNFITSVFEHSSTHNSFLQVIMIFGIFGEAWLIGCIVNNLINNFSVIKKERNYGAVFVALTLSAVSFMFTNTACIMGSTVDSFMLTIFTITIPRYVSNGLLEKN